MSTLYAIPTKTQTCQPKASTNVYTLCHCLYIQTQKLAQPRNVEVTESTIKHTSSRVHYAQTVTQELTKAKEQFQSEHQDLTFSSLLDQSPFERLISHLKHKPLPISQSSHQPSIADWQKRVLSPLKSSDSSECQNLPQMISKIRMPANMTSPLQTHSFQMKPWMKKKAEWWSYYCLGPRSHLSKEIKSYSWIWPT